MPTAEELKAIVNQLPDPDKNGTYADLDAAKIEQIDKAVRELRKGGRESVIGLIDMLVEPGKGDDVKPHFALHLLAVRATAPGEEAGRAELAAALASQVGGDRPKAVQQYLIEQLQVAGGKEVAPVLGKALLDADLCDHAARALAAIREGSAEQLQAALPKATGRQRLSVIKKLGVLRCPQAAEAFKQALADEDPDIRIAGAWGIARIADAAAAEALLKAADAATGWQRINQTDACMVLAEGLAAAGKKDQAAAIYTHLQKTRTDASESHVRNAAAKALAGLK